MASMAAPARHGTFIFPKGKAEQLAGICQAAKPFHRNKDRHALQFLSQCRSMFKVIIKAAFSRFNFKYDGDHKACLA